MSDEIHANHRERMRTRFLEHGLNHFQDYEILELLLFYAIPRKNVNPLAHKLIDEFGSLAGVLDANSADLCKIKGVGEQAAAFLNLLPQVFQRYQISKTDESSCDTVEKLAKYLIAYYTGKSYEQVCVVLLDNKCRVIRICEIGRGSASSVEIDTRRLIQCVLQYNAASVVLAHNHPRGECRASRADIYQTSRTRDLLKMIDVPLLDHIIVTEDNWVSIAAKETLPR